MINIRETADFKLWLKELKDKAGRAIILVRINRLALGNPGEYEYLGDKVTELKIRHGPGYRLYYTKKDNSLIILLCGGDKSSQQSDIQKAKNMVKHLEDYYENN